MANAGKLIARIRECGANVMMDGGKLHLINRAKLPTGAFEFIREHGKEIVEFLEVEAAFDERAAIIEFDGGLTRQAAEYLARLLQSNPPAEVEASDWSWFVGQAAKIIDRAPLRRVVA